MHTALALAVKFGMTLAAAAIAGYFIGVVNWGLFFMLALIGSVANYIIGDLMVLPAAGNVIASLGDGIMGALVAYIIAARNRAFAVNEAVMYAVIFGIIVAVGEFFFHKWLAADRKISPDP
jgi:hypothetical protein